MQRGQSCIYLTHITKHNLNMGSGHIHGSWSDSAHNAETPINSLRKLSGSILISCLMRKVCHSLWKILGKSYRFLKSRFDSLLFWLCCEELSATVQRWMKGRQSNASVSWLESMPALLQPGDQHAGNTLTPGKLRLRHSNKGHQDSWINEPVLETSCGDPFFVKQGKKENGWKWVVKDEESRKITFVGLLRSSMRKGMRVLHKRLYLKAYFFVNLLPSDRYKIVLFSLISAGWNSLLSEVMCM